MHAHIAPSIGKVAGTDTFGMAWLAQRYADQRWAEESGGDAWDALVKEGHELGKLNWELLVHTIADKAIELDCGTTNGGGEVFLDQGLLTAIPWCTEDEYQEWYS